MSEEIPTVRRKYMGFSGAVVENSFGVWDVNETARTSPNYPIKDIPEHRVASLDESGLFVDPADRAAVREATPEQPPLDESVAPAPKKKARK